MTTLVRGENVDNLTVSDFSDYYASQSFLSLVSLGTPTFTFQLLCVWGSGTLGHVPPSTFFQLTTFVGLSRAVLELFCPRTSSYGIIRCQFCLTSIDLAVSRVFTNKYQNFVSAVMF